jgi:hypothetical protein
MKEKQPRIPELSESEVQEQLVQWCDYNHIYHERMNTGAVPYQNRSGEKRYVKFGRPGMADLLIGIPVNGFVALGYVEVKSTKGKQSEHQKEFQQEMEALGIPYILARSVEDLQVGIEHFREQITGGQQEEV